MHIIKVIIARIFQNLAIENIPLRNIRVILESIINGAEYEKDVENLSHIIFVCPYYRDLRQTLTIPKFPQSDAKILDFVCTSDNPP